MSTEAGGGLQRRFGLVQATALNMINMIGIGPFITIPLLMTALGGPQAMVGWLVALIIVICDGMIWSELGGAMPLNPRNSGSMVFTWEQDEMWRVGVEAYYTGTQPLEDNPYLNSSPSYWIFGVLAARQIGPINVFVNVENLADERVTRTHSVVLPTQAPDGSWTTDAWAPLDGRVFNAGIRWRFAGGD